MLRWKIRQCLRPLAVRIVGALSLAALLRARRRFDDADRAGDRELRAPLSLRIARLRPIPRDVRSFSPPGRPDARFVNADSRALQQLYWLGLDELMRSGCGAGLWAALVSRSEDVVEIGANVGLYSVCGALTARPRYRAFEPHPGSANALRSNLAANGIAHVEVIEAAVVPDEWDRPSVDLVVPSAHDSATPSNATVAEAGDLQVVATPIGAAIEGCDLLKVDVEGFESVLFRSCLRALARIKPLVMVEVLDGNADLRAMLPEVVAALDGQAFAMGHAALRPVDAEALREGPLFGTYGSWDYMIVPASRAAVVEDLVETARLEPS